MSRVSRHLPHELSPEFDAILQRISLFSSPKFLSIWQTLGGSGVYWCYEANGTRNILAGIEYGTGILARFQSMPEGIYSFPFTFRENGWTQPTSEAMAQILDAIAKHRYCKVRLYDFLNCLPVSDRFSSGSFETHVINISRPDWEPPDATIRSEIRKAEREGIQVELFNKAKHFESFHFLMEQTELRHNRKPKYPASFFEALAHLATQDSRVIWKYCAHNGKPAASHIFFIEGQYALHWQVYFDKSFSWLKPNQYILLQTIRELQQRGIHTLSLGASPDDADGLRNYKEKWGGTPYQYQYLSRFSWLGKLL